MTSPRLGDEFLILEITGSKQSWRWVNLRIVNTKENTQGSLFPKEIRCLFKKAVNYLSKHLQCYNIAIPNQNMSMFWPFCYNCVKFWRPPWHLWRFPCLCLQNFQTRLILFRSTAWKPMENLIISLILLAAGKYSSEDKDRISNTSEWRQLLLLPGNSISIYGTTVSLVTTPIFIWNYDKSSLIISIYTLGLLVRSDDFLRISGMNIWALRSSKLVSDLL